MNDTINTKIGDIKNLMQLNMAGVKMFSISKQALKDAENKVYERAMIELAEELAFEIKKAKKLLPKHMQWRMKLKPKKLFKQLIGAIALPFIISWAAIKGLIKRLRKNNA